ncbi:MAG TPA: LUD domain-containing protein [Solirubrobacteraceae bacterium]
MERGALAIVGAQDAPGVGARSAVLERIRAALQGEMDDAQPVPRGYRHAGTGAAPGAPQIVQLFCDRLAHYGVTADRVRGHELAAAISTVCARRGVSRIVAPTNLRWVTRDPRATNDTRPGSLEIVPDDPPLSPAELDRMTGALTGCALGIAETGTIVLDGAGRSGRRALTLVPDYHLCVIEAEQIVAAVPDAIQVLAKAAADGQPLTWVSGPSATSDIELERVPGVHGPRTLDVLVIVE